MHPHSHAACIYPTHFVQWSYTHQLLHNQLLHQPAFTQTLFYIKHFCRNPLLHQPDFTQTRFYINPFFHKPPFTPTTSNLHKRAFTHTSFYANQLFDQPAFTQTTFAPTSFTQPLLWACRPKARGPAECRRVEYIIGIRVNIIWPKPTCKCDPQCWHIVNRAWWSTLAKGTMQTQCQLKASQIRPWDLGTLFCLSTTLSKA